MSRDTVVEWLYHAFELRLYHAVLIDIPCSPLASSLRFETPISMCANREPSAIPTWEVLLDSQPSSPSGSRNSSDSERAAGLSSLNNKRKAALPPATSLRPQKFARKETSRHPGMTVTEPEAVSRTKGAFRPLPSAASPITTKKKKVQLTRNRELLHSLLKPGSGIRGGAMPNPCRAMRVVAPKLFKNGGLEITAR
ncbi:hypothetical protein BC826DRAFT_421263 [Russula brevipes]|nr:hypothetical protein BC826DRAFT_421263 [Russula brevipes]